MAIAIAGMHRSGTSMVAHALKLGSVYFGEDSDFVEPTEENPDGYWEHARLVALNDEILARLGGGWERPPSVPSNFSDKRIRQLRRKAKSFAGEFSSHEPWAWKDPRASLTFDLWAEVVPDLAAVVCLRNPLEVALSLHRRATFSYSNSFELWETYYRRLIESTSERRRIVTEYESYFTRPRSEMRRLFEFAGIPTTRSALDASCAAIKKHLRHTRFTVQDLLDGEVAPDIVELYLTLRREAGLRDPAARKGRPLPAPATRSGPVVDVEAVRVKSLESTVEARELELGYVKDRLDSDRRSWQAEETHLKGELDNRERELQEAKRQLAERERQLGRVAEAQAKAEKQDEARLEAILAAQAELAGEVAELRSHIDKRLLPEVEAVQSTVYDLQAEADPEKHEYRKVVRQVREVVRKKLPHGSTVLVASKGDDDLVNLHGRRAWHFPRTESGDYAGYYPKSDLSAIAHLEALRSQGADHLLFPATAFWWLDHYPQLRRHLDERYRSVVKNDSCELFELRPVSGDPSGWKDEFREFLDEYRLSFGREPAILDLHTGFELVREFPQDIVFAPPAEANGLPYLDGTVDIVAVLQSKAALLAEADRVAAAAVLALSEGRHNGWHLDPRWKVEPAERPSVSIIIPCYDGLEHTDACLSTLLETLPRNFQGEIIVVDDASRDGTSERLAERARIDDRITVIRNPRNLGFLESANRGAEAASGDVLLFLNNDTVLLPRWLEPLLRVFVEHEDAGVVGGRLVYPDGTLQEAGGLVFADGSAWKYGYHDPDPADPLFSFFREVDYCSGCLLATRRSLFADLGGFDTSFAPGFYEDTDYCFAVRERGLRVYYEPESTIVHLEGATAGTDLDRGPKRHQALNQGKFARKWQQTLTGQPERPDSLDATTLSTLVTAREGSTQ